MTHCTATPPTPGACAPSALAMTAGELRRRYQEIGGDEARSRNREYLIRRILWMLQAGVYGGLSERAVALADGLARDFDVWAPARPMQGELKVPISDAPR